MSVDALSYIIEKYSLKPDGRVPIDLEGVGRLELADLFAELGFSQGAEIGVEKGLYSEILCKANPKLNLFSIDPWKAYPEYREHTTQEKIDEIKKEAFIRLEPYRVQIIQDFSENAVNSFADESLDFVYIDGNHDRVHVLQDLNLWTPKVKKGGIISGHDYVRYKGKYGLYNQVKDTVLEYTKSHNINPWFVLRDPRERSSWMWVKK